jgi:hypothetical protein
MHHRIRTLQEEKVMLVIVLVSIAAVSVLILDQIFLGKRRG